MSIGSRRRQRVGIRSREGYLLPDRHLCMKAVAAGWNRSCVALPESPWNRGRVRSRARAAVVHHPDRRHHKRSRRRHRSAGLEAGGHGELGVRSLRPGATHARYCSRVGSVSTGGKPEESAAESCQVWRISSACGEPARYAGRLESGHHPQLIHEVSTAGANRGRLPGCHGRERAIEPARPASGLSRSRQSAVSWNMVRNPIVKRFSGRA